LLHAFIQLALLDRNIFEFILQHTLVAHRLAHSPDERVPILFQCELSFVAIFRVPRIAGQPVCRMRCNLLEFYLIDENNDLLLSRKNVSLFICVGQKFI
jgi:hypothetical protein